MELGIFAKTFGRAGVQETLDAVRDCGLGSMQFNMALAGRPSLPEAIADELAAEVREATADRGLRMAAVSGTYNMAHPDADVRASGLRRLGVLIAAAGGLGTRVVTLCTGSRDAADLWRRHPGNTTPEAWRDMRAGVEAAAGVAESHSVTLAFEPEHNNVVGSAAAGRRLLDEIRSPRLKVVIDAANLFDGGDLTASATSCARRSTCSAATSCSPTPRTSATTGGSSRRDGAPSTTTSTSRCSPARTATSR